MEYLDFEMPIKELEDQLAKCYDLGKESDVDVSKTSKEIENKIEKVKKDIGTERKKARALTTTDISSLPSLTKHNTYCQ